MAWGAIAAAGLGYLATKDQADSARSGTRGAIGLQREQFDYAKQLQEALLRQQEPRRQSSQRAMRSLSSILGLGDPGPSAPVYQQQELTSLKDQLAGTDRSITSGPTTEGIENLLRAGKISPGQAAQMRLDKAERTENPEFAALQEEISALEAEMPGGEGFEDDFEGPQDITELPGFQFMKEEGLDALASSGAARGMQLSGRQMESAQRFGQGLASQFRGQLIGELQSMAGMRPSTAPVSNLGNLATGQAQAISPLLQQQGMIGAAEAAGTYGNLGALLGEIDFGQPRPAFNVGGYSGPPSTTNPVGGPMGFAPGGF